MIKVPVKLATREIVLSPTTAQQHARELEAMNRAGLMLRKMRDGGTVYAADGAVIPPPRNGISGKNLQQLGQFLYKSAMNDPNAIDAFSGGSSSGYQAKIDELVALGYTPEEAKAIAVGDKSAKDKMAMDKSNAEVVKLAEQMYPLFEPAGVAGDYINGYVKMPKEAEEKAAEEEKGLLANAGDLISRWSSTAVQGAASAISTAAGGHDITRRIREEARRRIVASSFPEEYTAYIKLRNIRDKMVQPILASGILGVSPTDADLQFAKDSIMDMTAPASSWAPQIDQLITLLGGEVPNAPESDSQPSSPTSKAEAPAKVTPNVNSVFSDDEDPFAPTTPSVSDDVYQFGEEQDPMVMPEKKSNLPILKWRRV